MPNPRRRNSEVLRDIARDVRRLRPDWRHPERYFEDRSEIENRLSRLARDMDRDT